ncbi:hypothetical protein GCM10010451_02700 [Streptomyces virens]|uniref:Uncharacterized protein n=1 Tax=Streptomyces virens TaxID=285572 RepID=A0ABP6NUM2_9ACTN|nr:hypothetical protein GCM10010247_42920 [Streptomyces calvus]
MGRELEPREEVHRGEPGRAETADVADDHPARAAATAVQQCPQRVAGPAHLIRGEGAAEHEYGWCLGVHDR